MDPDDLYEHEMHKVQSRYCFPWTRGDVYNLSHFGDENSVAGDEAMTYNCTLTVMVNPTNHVLLVEDFDQVSPYLCLLFLSMVKHIIILTGCNVQFLVPDFNVGGDMQPDGTFNGYYGYLYNNTADMLLFPGTFKTKRMPYLDFGYVMPVKSVLSLISISNKHVRGGLEAIFAIFELDIWIMIIVFTLLSFSIKMVDFWAQHRRDCEYHRAKRLPGPKCSRPEATTRCTLEYFDYSNVPLFFFGALLGLGGSITKVYKVFDQLLLVWIWCSFLLRQMFLSRTQSLLVTDSPLKIDSIDQLEHYIHEYHLYVESTTTTKDFFVQAYPSLEAEVEKIYYMEMFDQEFIRQFCFPSLRYNYLMFRTNKHQVKATDFDLLSFVPGDPKGRRRTSTTTTTTTTTEASREVDSDQHQSAELKHNLRKRYKKNSALVAREVNIDQLIHFYHTVNLYKAKTAEVVWPANFVLRHGLDARVRKRLAQLFRWFHQFGLFERVYNSEIYQQKFLLLADTLYQAWQINQNASDDGVAVDVEALRVELLRGFFQKSLIDSEASPGATEEGDETAGELSNLSIDQIYPHIVLYLINNVLAMLLFLGECGHFFLTFYLRERREL